MVKKIIGRIIPLILTIIIGFILNYICLPAWNFRSKGFCFFIFLMALVATILLGISEYIIDEKPIGVITGVVVTVLILIVLLSGIISSAKMFHASRYQSLITIEEGNFDEEITQINDTSNITIVDVSTADKLGDRTIANLKNASWYEVDNEYNVILYHGQQFRISPINYGGFWKYLKAKTDGIPGYVIVNSITQEAQLVTLEKPIKYSPSAYFSYDLTRHLRSQYPSCMFGSSFFEIDEDGNPYWITSVKSANIGLFGGQKEEYFIITDACTGESMRYSTEELPDWVDHAFDLSYLMQLVNYNFKYVNGFFNFSQTNVNVTSYQYKDKDFDGYNTAISSDGVVFYTGVTPASSAESNIGFILANPRTGVVKFYDCPGAEESSAQSAAEGLVQNLDYKATFPTILNVDGEPTYFMCLKDKAKLIQGYVLCNVANYTMVVQDKTIEGALEQYKAKINGENSETPDKDEEQADVKLANGIISEIYQAEIDGYTYFYFKLEHDENIYMSSITNSNKQVFLSVGTKVKIEYVLSAEDGVYTVTKIEF